MPRFYFDFRDGEERVRDDDGKECADLGAAMHEAAQTAGDYLIAKNASWLGGGSVIVRDYYGEIVATLIFSLSRPEKQEAHPMLM